MYPRLALAVGMLLVPCTSVTAEILNVPGEYSTIQMAIDAATKGDEVVIADGVYAGSGNTELNFNGRSITVRSANGPDNCVIDGDSMHRAFIFENGESPEAIVKGLTIRNCFAKTGGTVQIINASRPTFVNCRLIENAASGPCAGMRVVDWSAPTLIDCVFKNNNSFSAGALFVYQSDATILNCRFLNNTTFDSGAAILSGLGTVTCINSIFAQNSGGFIGGGWAHAGGGAIVNSVFSQNSSVLGGGMYLAESMMIVNSTFSYNTHHGLTITEPGTPTLINSILWGNSDAQIGEDPNQDPGVPSVFYSDVQGGWSGAGANNINADPLFVQAGTSNVRLAFGSPCVNAGDIASLPDDEFDLDDDGVTDEPIPIDLDGLDRVQSKVVDMGPYEGEYEALPPAAVVEDLDPGELGTLTPCGGEFDLLENAVVLVINQSGPEDSTYQATCIVSNLYPLAGGFSELGVILRTESSMEDGQFLSRIFIPFDEAMLNGLDPLSLNALWYDEFTGNWRLAVANNTQNSPDYDGPIGDRIVVENSENDFGLSTELGDYGVFWNPDLHQGFVWANTDHLGDYALGASLCQSECFPEGGDGVIDIGDLLGLIGAWIEGTDALCDYDGDGVPDMSDLLALIASWGQCTGPGGLAPLVALAPRMSFAFCPQQGPCVGDLDHDGLIDLVDLLALYAAWGDCKGCAEDLNGDQTVDRKDLQVMNRSPTNR